MEIQKERSFRGKEQRKSGEAFRSGGSIQTSWPEPKSAGRLDLLRTLLILSWLSVLGACLPGESGPALGSELPKSSPVKAGHPFLSSAGRPVLLVFMDLSCSKCRRLQAVLKEVSSEFPAAKSDCYLVIKEGAQVPLSALPCIAISQAAWHKTFLIRSIPTMLLYDRNGKLVRKEVGSRSASSLRQLFREIWKP